MSVLDFNWAEAPRSTGLIPDGSKSMVVMTIRPGGAGDEGILKASRDGVCLMLDLEFTCANGPFARRKFWSQFVVDADPACATDGQRKAVDISRGHLRAILESVRGIMPGDTSDAAMQARRISSYRELNGLTFAAEIALEKGKAKPDGSGEKYPDRNTLGKAITPDEGGYVNPGPQTPTPMAGPQQAQGFGGGFAAQAQPQQTQSAVNKPAWAA